MAISSTTSKLTYNGDGSTTVFAISFVFWLDSHIKAILRDASGAETDWVQGTQYTLTGGDGAAGTLTVETSPTDYTPQSGETLVIKSVVPETQTAELPLGGPFPSTTVEQMVDLATRQVQQHSEEIGRTISVPETDSASGLVLPIDSARANKDFQFDAGGNPIMVEPSDASGTAVTATGSTTSRQLAERFTELKNVRDYGAVGDDATDDSAAFTAARTEAGSDRPIIGVGGDFNQVGETGLFGTTNPATADDALGFMMYLGSDISPTTRHEPLIRLEKFTNSDRTVESGAFDQGALYVTVTRSGTPSNPSPAPAVNFYARAEQDANVQGAHMRGAAEASGASAWGGWSYAQTAVTDPDRLIAHEFNIRNTGAASTWDAGAATGAISGIVIATADSSLPATHGIRIADITSPLTGGFRTAIGIDTTACVGVSGTTFQDGEAIYIAGGATVGERIGGVRLGTGNFLYGFSTKESTINNNCAFLMADNQRLVWGTEPNSGSWLSFNGTSFDFNGLLDLSTAAAELRIDGTKVVDARITGWAAATGTATRTTFVTSSVTLPQLAERVKALIDDLISHGLIGT